MHVLACLFSQCTTWRIRTTLVRHFSLKQIFNAWVFLLSVTALFFLLGMCWIGLNATAQGTINEEIEKIFGIKTGFHGMAVNAAASVRLLKKKKLVIFKS
jgi:hypothetical protein